MNGLLQWSVIAEYQQAELVGSKERMRSINCPAPTPFLVVAFSRKPQGNR